MHPILTANDTWPLVNLSAAIMPEPESVRSFRLPVQATPAAKLDRREFSKRLLAAGEPLNKERFQYFLRRKHAAFVRKFTSRPIIMGDPLKGVNQ